MADNVTIPGAAFVSATDEIAGTHFQRVKLIHGADGVNAGDVSTINGLPVQGPLTDTQLRATAVPVSGPLTDAQLRATAVPISGALTDTQLRATPVKITSELRTVSFSGAAGTFRTLGNAATLHNLLTIENAVGSSVIVSVNSINLQMDATAVLTAVMPTVKTSRPTALPTGGTVLSKVTLDTAETSSASVVLRGATASDGGAATAITATQGPTIRGDFTMRLHTAVGQVLGAIYRVTPSQPIILRAGEAVLVCVDGVGTSNPATNHWQLDVEWEEYV